MKCELGYSPPIINNLMIGNNENEIIEFKIERKRFMIKDKYIHMYKYV